MTPDPFVPCGVNRNQALDVLLCAMAQTETREGLTMILAGALAMALNETSSTRTEAMCHAEALGAKLANLVEHVAEVKADKQARKRPNVPGVGSA